MNPLNINHIKLEKTNSIKFKPGYQKLRTIKSFFRAFELFLVLAVISRLSFRIPIGIHLAFKLFDEYFRRLLLLLVSPQFVFILGNVIVITLFVNSGNFNNPRKVKLPKRLPHERKNIKLLPKERGVAEENTHPREVKLPKSPQHNNKSTIAMPKKQGITEENTMKAAKMVASSPENQRQVAKIYHRSKSEMPRRILNNEVSCFGTLRRSKTEVMKSLNMKEECWEEKGKCQYPEDHMSNEEFKRTIEDFIAKQQMFLREEEFSGVESNFVL